MGEVYTPVPDCCFQCLWEFICGYTAPQWQREYSNCYQTDYLFLTMNPQQTQILNWNLDDLDICSIQNATQKNDKSTPSVKTNLLISYTMCCALPSLAVPTLVTHWRYPWNHILIHTEGNNTIWKQDVHKSFGFFFFWYAHSQLISSRNIWARGEQIESESFT